MMISGMAEVANSNGGGDLQQRRSPWIEQQASVMIIDGGDEEFSHSDELSFSRSDELSDVGDPSSNP